MGFPSEPLPENTWAYVELAVPMDTCVG